MNGIVSAITGRLGLPILAGVLMALAFVWHGHEAKQARDAAYLEGAKDQIAIFTAAQLEADRLAQVGVKVTEGKQAAISEGSSHALQADLVSIDARADAIRLRHEATAPARSAPRRVDLPEAGEAASEPCPAPADDGLPWSVAFPLMVQAEKNQAKLVAVLKWQADQEALADKEAALGSAETK